MERNLIKHISKYGISLDLSTVESDVLISNNHFFDIGYNAIHIRV